MIPSGMAMTLRLSDDDNDALRAQADIEGRSMQTVARDAIREYVGRRRHAARVREASARGAKQYDKALRRLGSA